jgi:hypothetical protein
MSRWFKFPKASRVGCGPNRSSRRSVPIRLEALEDRLAPATFNVTTLADGGPGSGSLRAAILQSDATPGPNTINLMTPGTYQLSLFGAAHNGTNGALQIINQSVTIANASGGHAIIDGGGVDRVFDIEGNFPGGVTFTGLTITGGLAGADSNPGIFVGGSSGDGGAIFSFDVNVTLNSCQILNNIANSQGGGIWTDSASITLNSSTVSGNNASSAGGGIGSFAGIVSVTNSIVAGNVSDGDGGGIWTQVGNVTLNSSTVSDNNAEGSGGGIAIDQGSTSGLSINNSTISDNVAGQSGGGVSEDTNSGNTSVIGSAITGNSAARGQGGGISVQTTTLSMTSSTISGNLDAFGGGGLNISCTTLSIMNSSINNNRSEGFLVGGGGGGVNAFCTTGTFTNVNVIGNRSGEAGGGVAIDSGTVSMKSCNISDNFAGQIGGINVSGQGTAATFTDCTINGNHAGGRVGGMAFAGAELDITSCAISDNTTADEAGGLFLGDASVLELIQNSTISDNWAAGNGGGIEIANGNSTRHPVITDCTIGGNRAAGDGGGVFDATSGNKGLDFFNDTISGNTASGNGGGMAFERSGTDADILTAVTISGNSAAAGGGAFVLVNAPAPIVFDATIAGNHANTNAGQDLDGTFTSDGNNLIGVEDAACTSFTNGNLHDQVGTVASPINPLLGPLESNGGPNFTMILQPGSPAIAAGGVGPLPLTFDQRAFDRPGAGQSAPSIGALETQLPSFLGTSANGAYVENLYETLLDRTADPGAAGFVTMLNNGSSRATVVSDIVHSTEYLTDEVQALYVTYLHRAADPGGLQHFVGVLTSGGTVEQVEEAIAGSPEYFQLHGGTNEAFLTAIYYDALGRGGSPAEQAGFLQGLNAGTFSRAQVAAAIFGSAEYQQDLVEYYYQEFLGRNADPGGLAAWEAQLKSGMTDGQLVAALLGSGEGFAKRS